LIEEEDRMTNPKAMRAPWADIAPDLTEITNSVLFDNVWQRPQLSPRDRSLVTISALIALYRSNELPFHLKKALENGVTREEIIEVITHLAFYSGWPTASTALTIARQVFADAEQIQANSKEKENADA
jgi:4-carboxymuconolactone decarboxylase